MTTNFKFDIINKTIVCSKSALKKASNPSTAEYKELMAMIEKQPTFTIVEREIKKNDEKKTYKKLTFEVMESYIETQPDSEKMIIKYKAVKKVAKAKNSIYPLTKKWFLETYPEYKENNVANTEISEIVKVELEKKNKTASAPAELKEVA